MYIHEHTVRKYLADVRGGMYEMTIQGCQVLTGLV